MWVLLLVVISTHALIHGNCNWDPVRMHAMLDQPHVSIEFVTRNTTTSQLYFMARAYADGYARKIHAFQAFVVVDCASQNIGVSFTNFSVGMTCGTWQIQYTMSEVDALEEEDAFITKLAHVLRMLPRWWKSGQCKKDTDTIESLLRIGYFGLAMYLLYMYYTRYYATAV